MPVTVSCPKCSRQLRLPSEAIGSSAACPLCKTSFITRDLGNDRAQAIPLGAPTDSNRPEPVPHPRNSPDLSLGDEIIPIAPLYEESEASRDADKEPPQEDRRRRDPGPRRRDEDRPRRRRDHDRREGEPRKSKSGAVKFSIVIHKDPNERLKGRFDAEIDATGLRLWRGRGRTIEVPRDAQVKKLDGAKLSVPIEGREVELAVVDPDGRSLILAEQVVEVFAGQRETVVLPRVRKKPSVGWLVLAPLSIPLLAGVFGNEIGSFGSMVAWSILAAVLMGICALFLFVTRMSARGRAIATSIVTTVGLLILGLAFLFDRAAIPANAWQVFEPADKSFTVSMPGEPERDLWFNNDLRGMAIVMHRVDCDRAGFVFEVGVAEIKPERAKQLGSSGLQLDHFRTAFNPNLGNRSDWNQAPANVSWRDYEGAQHPRYNASRFVLQGRRLLILSVTSDRRISRFTPQVRRFFDSGKLAPAQDRPDPVQPDPVRPDPVRPGPEKVEPVKPPTPEIGPGGKVVGRGEFAWVGWSKEGDLVAVSQSGKVHVFESAGREKFWVQTELRVPVVSAALSPDSSKLMVASASGGQCLVDLRDQRIEQSFNDTPNTALSAVAWSPDGKTIATAHGDGKVRLRDAQKKDIRVTLDISQTQVLSLGYSPDGRYLAVADGKYQIYLFDPKTDKALNAWPALNGRPTESVEALRSLAFSADNRHLLAACKSSGTQIWDTNNGELQRTTTNNATVTAVAYFPTGKLYAVANDLGAVTIYHSATGQSRGTVRRQGETAATRGSVRNLAFSLSGQLAVAVGERVELYDIEQAGVLVLGTDRVMPVVLPRELTRIIPQATNRNQQPLLLRVCDDGSHFLVFGAPDRRITLYDSAELKPRFETPLDIPNPAIALSPDGTTLARWEKNQIELQATRGGKNTTIAVGGPSVLPPLIAFSGDGKRLASAHRALADKDRQRIRVFDVAGGKEISKFATRETPTWLAVSPDGRTVAVSGVNSNVIRLHDAADGREYAGLKGHEAQVIGLTYSPDGKRLASMDSNGRVRIFDTAKGRELRSLTGHQRPLCIPAFSPDSKTLACVGEFDKNVYLWDVESGERLKTLEQDGSVVGVGFGPKGESLIVGTNLSVNRWDLRKMPELKKRPAPVPVDLDKSLPPEVPDFQRVGRIESHLTHVIDPKAGYLLAFTHDGLCLRYSYPGLKLQAALYTDELINLAGLDAERGVLYTAARTKNTIHIYDVKAILASNPGQRITPIALPTVDGTISSLAVSEEGLIYLESREGEKGKSVFIGRLAPRTYKLKEQIEVSNQTLVSQIAPDGKSLYLAGLSTLQVVDLEKFVAAKPIQLNRGTISGLEVSDKYVVVQTNGGPRGGVSFHSRANAALPEVMHWNFPEFHAHPRIVGGRLYVLEVQDRWSIQAYDIDSMRADRIPPMAARYDPVDASFVRGVLQLSPDGKHLLSPTGGVVRISGGELVPPGGQIEARPQKEPEKAPEKLKTTATWLGHSGRVVALAYSPDGKKALTAGGDWQLIVRSTLTGAFQKSQTSNAPLFAVDWSRDGRWAVTTASKSFYLPTTTKQILKEKSRAKGVSTSFGVAFSADNKDLLIGYWDEISVWSNELFAKEKEQPIVVADARGIWALAAHEKAILAGCGDGSMRVFEPGTYKHTQTLKGHQGRVRCVALSDDGKIAVSGGVDGKITIWDVENQKRLHSLEQGAVVIGVAISGKVIASGGLDGSIKLWDLESGKETATEPARPGEPVYALTFSPDGQTLAVASGNGVRLIAAPAGAARLVVVPKSVDKAELPKKKVNEQFAIQLSFGDAVFDAKKQLVYTTSGSLLKIHKYSAGWKSEGLYVHETSLPFIGLDAERNRLLGIKAGAGIRKADVRFLGGNPELVTYDISRLNNEAGKMSEMKFESRLKLQGELSAAGFTPDGKILYYLSKDAGAESLIKVDTVARKELKSAKTGQGAGLLCVTPSGKNVYVASWERNDKAKLQQFDAATFEVKGECELDFRPTELVATDDGKVCIAGAKQAGFVLVLLDAAKGFRETHRSTPTEELVPLLPPDQAAVYLCPRKGKTTFTVEQLSTRDDKPKVAPLIELEKRGSGFVPTTIYRKVMLSPDGTILLHGNSGAWRLK